MKIESVRIENFRGFSDETITFNDFTCLVGPNGAGKSTVLTALNVFFRQYRDSRTDLSRLSVEDFHHRNVKSPIRITVTFGDLSPEARADLADYERQGKLIVSAVANYDANTERAEVRQFGSRLGMGPFREYFEADKRGENASALKSIFSVLRDKYQDLDDARTKPAMADALRTYEAANPALCEQIPSEDQFYGASKGANRLAPHLQWVFVPAVKDVTEEGLESKTSGLGQLLSRTVRSKVNFSDKVAALREALKQEYQTMLDGEQATLDTLSGSLELKLRDWAHPAVTARVLWTQDADRSVKVDEPWALIRLGERGFEGELARFGHGMQRSFMLTLLQEIASATDEGTPTLILAIEEPELYQHPPQAKYLADVLHDLSSDGSQVMVCSHSPLFIPGDDIETVRVIRDLGVPSRSTVSRLSYEGLAAALSGTGKTPLRESGMLAKLYPALNPGLNEMFFCRVLVLVEGLEDVAYLTSYLSLLGVLGSFRKCGCHIVPVGGKSELIKPLAMAKQLAIPVHVVVDADTDTDSLKVEWIRKHKDNNRDILRLMEYGTESDWPSEDIWKADFVMWKSSLTSTIDNEIGEPWARHKAAAAAHYGHAGDLRKNPLAISRALESAWNDGQKSSSLERLVTQVISFSEESVRGFGT